MIDHLNLASHPFGRNRLFWVSCGLAAALLAAAAVWMLAVYFQTHEPPPELVQGETQLRAELVRLAQEESQARRTLEDPANAVVLERSQFLNELLYRKGISWTRTFADLEKVLPPRVLMVQIRPEITLDNKIRLDMQVGAESWQDFIEFVKELESSDLFGSASLEGYSPPSDNQPLYRYQVTVSYDQRL
jgi:type IV pilus assembly protein PilN